MAERITTVARMNSEDLDMSFIEAVKKMFPNQKIDIKIETSNIDETEFLLSNPSRKVAIEQSVASLDAGQGIIFTAEEFDRFVQENS